MFERLRDRVLSAASRLRRFERRELRTIRRRLEETRVLLHVSILLVVPVLVGLLTFLANRLPALSFFLIPPLTTGAYVLFAHPEGEYAAPVRFVGGLTTGAVCAWISVWAVTGVTPAVAPNGLTVGASGAAFAVFLTAAVTWVLRLEQGAAFAVAILGLLVDPSRLASYVISVFLGSSIVAGFFYAWHDLVYERRATYLYESTTGDDHVLVPLRGQRSSASAMLGARLAAAHDAGKVVLLDVVEEAWVASAERSLLSDADASHSDSPVATPADIEDDEIVSAVDTLESRADRIEQDVGVPCQVVVAVRESSAAETVRDAAHRANCDLIVAPYETEDESVTPFIRNLFRGDIDVLVHRSHAGRTEWTDVMVPVRQASDVAHSMLDFAGRLAGKTGRVSACHCIRNEDRRRRADRMLADLAETIPGHIETRVAQTPIEQFVKRNADAYHLVIVGASRDRSAASRLFIPPTFERLQRVDTDLAIVDRH